MTTYLVLYRDTSTAAEQMAELDPEVAAASMKAWSDWQQKAGDTVVDFGSPTQPVAGADDGATTFIGGYSVMQADSVEDLEATLADHPHKTQGGTIEILELLTLPEL